MLPCPCARDAGPPPTTGACLLQVRDTFRARSKIISCIRRQLEDRGFLEVRADCGCQGGSERFFGGKGRLCCSVPKETKPQAVLTGRCGEVS